MSSIDDNAPRASTEEDLPGYVRSKKYNARITCSTTFRRRCDVFTYLLVIFLIGQLVAIEGCLPSWFRQERSEPQALDDSHLITNEIDDPPELLDQERLRENGDDSEDQQPLHENNKLEEIDDNSDESEELDMIYGTAAPIRMDHKLEEARRRHSKRKCKGWCYRGGNCTVDVDEVTYELRSVNCHCPHGYWGSRCELHFVARLFAPVKGHVEVEKSGVSAFAFIILMLIVSIGLIFYTYRKIIRRNAAFDSSTLLSLNHHLRRPTVSFRSMPTSVNTTPTSSAAYFSRSTLQQFNCRTPFSPFSRSYSHLSGNLRSSTSDLNPSLSMAFGRLSMSSTRLHNNLDLPKVDSRRSSCTANRISTTASLTNQIQDESAYYTAFGTMIAERSTVDEQNSVQSPPRLITADKSAQVNDSIFADSK